VRTDAAQFYGIQIEGAAVKLLAQHLESNTGLRYDPELPNRNYLQNKSLPPFQDAGTTCAFFS